MVTLVEKIYFITKYFRFQPIDPDTLIYSNDEDEGQSNPNPIERVLQLETPNKTGSLAKNQTFKNRRFKQVTRKVSLSRRSKNDLGNDVLGGKDLDSISPLIKRLLVDTYEHNQKKQEKLNRSQISRRRKSNIFGSDQVVEADTRRIARSINKWQSNRIPHKVQAPINASSRKKPPIARGTLCNQKSQSLERIVDAKSMQTDKNLMKYKVLYIERSKRYSQF